LVGKSEQKRPSLGRPKLRWEDSIKKKLREMGYEVVD
jgi:hypothetical protein